MPAHRQGNIIGELVGTPIEVRGVLGAALERCEATYAHLRGKLSWNCAERQIPSRGVQRRSALIVLHHFAIDSKPQSVQYRSAERVVLLQRGGIACGAIGQENVVQTVGRAVGSVIESISPK